MSKPARRSETLGHRRSRRNAFEMCEGILVGEHGGIPWLATPPDRTATDGTATLWQLHMPVPVDHLWAVFPEELFIEGLPMAVVWPVRPTAADILGWRRSSAEEAWFTTMARSRTHARQLAAHVASARTAMTPGALTLERAVALLSSPNPGLREWVLTQVLLAGAPMDAPDAASKDAS